MKVLLPVDGSDHTRRMLEHLAAHPALLPGDHEFLLFTVIEPYSPYKTDFAKAVSMEEFLRQQAEHVLAPLRAYAQQQGWKVETDYVPGTPLQAIVDKAQRWQPDLIVMGTHARSPLGNFVLGSVANGVLGGCKVPVLLIR